MTSWPKYSLVPVPRRLEARPGCDSTSGSLKGIFPSVELSTRRVPTRQCTLYLDLAAQNALDLGTIVSAIYLLQQLPHLPGSLAEFGSLST